MAYVVTPYRSGEENEKLKEKENKLALKLDELGFVECPQCRKKLVRVFAAKSGRKPVFRGDVSDYLRRMRNAIKTYENRGVKSLCHVSGPEYTVVFNSSHFAKPYSDNLGENNSYGHCGRGCYLGYSAVDVVSRLFLRVRQIRQACIVNGVEPQEIRDWMETQKETVLSSLFGYGYSLQKVEGTNLWAGIYQHSEFNSNTINYDVTKVAGLNWARELDLVIDNAPPTTGAGGKYVMSPTHGCVEYSTTNYKADLAIDLPVDVAFIDLVKTSWDRIVDVETLTGVRAKLKVSHSGGSAKTINSMNRALHDNNVPRKFWVVQADKFLGSSAVEKGDIVL